MEGGELFNRIQERTAFNERGNLNIYTNPSVYSNKYIYRSSGDRERHLYCCQVPP